MSFRRAVAAAILLNFVVAMGMIQLARTWKHVTPRRVTHQERLANRPEKVRFAIMDDYVRDTLIADWDKHANDTLLLERGFCLKWQYDLWAGEKAYRVTQISRPTKVEANSYSIGFECERGPYVAEVHIHPAQTCSDEEGTKCWRGGPYAWQCLPSDQDVNYITRAGQKFGMIQCAREAVVSYFPLELILPPLVFIPPSAPQITWP